MTGHIVLFVLLAIPVAAWGIFILSSRSRYKNRKNAGIIFFENDSLVLNTGLPYPILLNDIECVELSYRQWEQQHLLHYPVKIKVIQKSGKSKSLAYECRKYGKPGNNPSDMKTALEEKGVRCVINSL